MARWNIFPWAQDTKLLPFYGRGVHILRGQIRIIEEKTFLTDLSSFLLCVWERTFSLIGRPEDVYNQGKGKRRLNSYCTWEDWFGQPKWVKNFLLYIAACFFKKVHFVLEQTYYITKIQPAAAGLYSTVACWMFEFLSVCLISFLLSHPNSPFVNCISRFTDHVSNIKIGHNTIILFVCPTKILHKHCCHFLLGFTMVPRENKCNTYAKFWRDKQRVLWYFWKWPITFYSTRLEWEANRESLFLSPTTAGLLIHSRPTLSVEPGPKKRGEVSRVVNTVKNRLALSQTLHVLV